MGGGRSSRSSRAVPLRAPAWSDAAAAAVLRGLQDSRKAAAVFLQDYLHQLFERPSMLARFLGGIGLGQRDCTLASQIFAFYAERFRARDMTRNAQCGAFLRSLRVRHRSTLPVVALSVARATGPKGTFHSFLVETPNGERRRDVSKSARALAGVSRWPLSWLRVPGVVCYERAAGRVLSERNGLPDAKFMRGVVKVVELPTAVANRSNHYLLLLPGGSVRYMSVEEVSRSCGILPESPLMGMLSCSAYLTPTQAVTCLGAGVHAAVARQVVVTLIARGALPACGITYGSSCSGIDTFAAGLDAATRGHWTYVFASEQETRVRAALLGAWGVRGLRAESCFSDACGVDAENAPLVDLFVLTPNCAAYSRCNRYRSDVGQDKSLGDVFRCLAYVRLRRPRVVIVENVCESGVVGPVTGLLSRLVGYARVETSVLDPRDIARLPVARERQFWVLVRV